MAVVEVQGRSLVPTIAPDELPEGTIPGTWGWGSPLRRGNVGAATARMVRKRRMDARLDHPALWRAGLAHLPHYAPDYEYDVAHEYERDWTTDPDYGAEGVKLLDYDEDGFVSPNATRHGSLIALIVQALRDSLGNRVANEPELHFDQRIGAMLGLLTGEGKGKKQVVPDLVVLPPELAWPADRERGKRGRVLHLEQGDLVPELVAEVVSPISEQRDLEDKRALYAALGIAEYLVIEPGEPPDPFQGDPEIFPAIRLYRLESNGSYQLIGDSSEPFQVCGTLVRLSQPEAGRMPVFQWWDEHQELWRDPASDRERHGIRLGEVMSTLKFLDAVLPDLSGEARNLIEAHWLAEGLPEDVANRILAAGQRPDEWRALLEIPR